MRHLLVFILFLVMFMSGCGSNLPPVGSVTISVSPARSTIAPGETVVVTGAIAGYSGDKQTWWTVRESYDNEQKTCRFITGKESSASFAECKYGYLIYEDTSAPMHATYYAPPTPGTYHLTFDVLLIGPTGFSDSRTQSANTAIDVK